MGLGLRQMDSESFGADDAKLHVADQSPLNVIQFDPSPKPQARDLPPPAEERIGAPDSRPDGRPPGLRLAPMPKLPEVMQTVTGIESRGSSHGPDGDGGSLVSNMDMRHVFAQPGIFGADNATVIESDTLPPSRVDSFEMDAEIPELSLEQAAQGMRCGRCNPAMLCVTHAHAPSLPRPFHDRNVRGSQRRR